MLGVAYNDLLRSSGKLPVIINPAQASLTGYTFKLIKQDGTEYSIQPSSVTEGFTGAFAQFAAAPSNGLYTLNFTPTRAAAVAASTAALYPAGYAGGVAGESYELAVRATKGAREIFSGFQYAVKVRADVNTVATPKAGVDLTPGWPNVYVPIGTSKDLLSYFDRTAPAPTVTLTAADFFKVAVVQLPGNTDVENLITKTNGTVSTAITTATVSNLNDRIVPMNVKTFDWMGRYRQRVDVTFFSH